MSGIFKAIGKLLGVKSPDPAPVIIPSAPAAPPPTAEQAAAARQEEKKEAKIEQVNALVESERDAAAAAQEAKDAKLRKKGRAALFYTGDEGAGLPKTAAKALLGE